MDTTEVQALVRALDGDLALVEIQGGGCGRCHEEGGCGGHHLTQSLCTTPKSYSVHNQAGAKVGDVVTVRISARSLFWSATLAYVFPILALLFGAFLGMRFGGDHAAMLGGGFGLALVWLLVRHAVRFRTGNPDFRPQIVCSDFDSTKVRR